MGAFFDICGLRMWLVDDCAHGMYAGDICGA